MLLRLRHPDLLSRADVRLLLEDGFSQIDGLPPPADILADLPRLVSREDLLLLLARDEERWRGFALATAPSTRLTTAVSVYAFFTKDSGARKELAEGLVTWARQRGATAIDTMNTNVGRDRAFQRLFRSTAKSEPVGTVFRFHLEDT